MKKRYTSEEDAFLRKHINDFSYKELVQRLNTKYGNNRTLTAVKRHCWGVLKLTTNRTGYFESGGNPHNKKPIGFEKWENGYLWVKVDCTKEKNRTHGAFRKNWKQKHLIVYENFYGKIPDGKQVVFLDGDKTNLDISNLYCVDVRIMAAMNANKWFTDNRDLTLTAIKWCELFYSLKEG